MASITREFIINARPNEVWSVISDFAHGPMKVAAGSLIDCRLERSDLRTLVFADGTEAQEELISRNKKQFRVAWRWVKEGVHDNASMQIFSYGDKQSRLVWIHDTLPRDAAEFIEKAMDQQVPLIKRSLGQDGNPKQEA